MSVRQLLTLENKPRFIAVGGVSVTSPKLASSGSSKLWTPRDSKIVGREIMGVTYGSGLFVVVGRGETGTHGQIATSVDGVNWTARESNTSNADTIGAVCYGGGLYVAVGIKACYSADGITWTANAVVGMAGNDVIYDGSEYIAVGVSGRLRTSADAITWGTPVSGFGASNINAIAFGNATYVAVGVSGKATSSTDKITWTIRDAKFGSTEIRDVIFDGTQFVAIGTSTGQVTTSPDGINWIDMSAVFPGATGFAQCITYGTGLYVVGFTDGKIYTSSDLVTWIQSGTGFGTDSVNDVVFSV